MKLPCLAVLAIALLPTAGLARPLTARDLVSLSQIEHPAVSRDDRWLVWAQIETDLASNRRHESLWRLDLAQRDGAPQKLDMVQGADLRMPTFGSDGRLYFLARTGDATSAVWSVAAGSGAPTKMTGDDDISGFLISPNADAILVWADRPVGATSLNVRAANDDGGGSARIYERLFVRHLNRWQDGQRSQLFLLPLAQGKAAGVSRAIAGGLEGDIPSKPAGQEDEIAWAPDGRTIYFALREPGDNEALSINFDIFAVQRDASAAPTKLTPGNPAIDTKPAISPDGRWLAWIATTRPGYEADRGIVMVRELASGRVHPLTLDWDRSIDSIAWALDSRSVYVTAAEQLDHPCFQIALSDGRIQRLTPRGHVSDVRPLADGSVIYLQDSLTAAPDLWLRTAQGRFRQLTFVNRDRLANVDRAPVNRFSFKGAGGDLVWGIVMRPAKVPGHSKAPVALLVHGGPQSTASDSWAILMNRLVWAGRGYASVSIDFHGSVGYGQSFVDSVNSDWGGKPLEDLKLGLAAATRSFDDLDSDAVCGIGGSYGGYMMNWIEGTWPERFKCLVQADGVFDVRAMVYETDELWADRWDHGNQLYFEAPSDYEASNPVNLVASWRTPQLVVTGENDFRTPYTQALAAFTALQLRGVPSRLVVFPDEGHGARRPRNVVQWFDEVLGWMDRWTRTSQSLDH